ncbi:MAG: hypothetical protein B6A08_04770 [Sorangiineae bacterium NIC37A_2]|nr:MAG: hypothetical protein B6A08_04770 [Sorangiineae bacterium NIC37A_2]
MRRHLLALGFGICLLGSGCKRSEPKLDEDDKTQPKEVEPPEVGERGASSCQSVPGAKFALLSGGRGLETGVSAPFRDGFAVSALEGEKEHRIRVYVRQGTTTRDVSLERVYGGDEPPKLAGHSGGLTLAWLDRDAGGKRIALAAVVPEGEGFRVGSVAEVETNFRPLESLELAARGNQVLLVWDSSDPKKKDKGSVYCARRDAVSLAPIGAPRRVSPPEDDAARPLLLPAPGGYWLLWASIVSKGNEGVPETDGGLVAAPPEILRVQRLGEDCAPLAQPLDLTSPAPNLEFSATGAGEALWVVSRDDSAPAPTFRHVTASGSVAIQARPEETIVGLPLLFDNGGTPWILATARDGASLLGVGLTGAPLMLRPEPALLGVEVLGAAGGGLVIERREGGAETIRIDLISCGTGAAAPQ